MRRVLQRRALHLLRPATRFSIPLAAAVALETGDAWLEKMAVLALEPLPAGAFLSGVLFGRVGVGGWLLGQLAWRLTAPPASASFAEPVAFVLIGLVGDSVFRLGGRLGRGFPDLRSYFGLFLGAALGALVSASLEGFAGLDWRGVLIHAASHFVSILLVAPLVMLLADRYLRGLMSEIAGERRTRHRFPASLEIGRRSPGGVPLVGRVVLLTVTILLTTAAVVLLTTRLPQAGTWPLLVYLGVIVWAVLGHGLRGGLYTASLAGASYLLARSWAERSAEIGVRDLSAVGLYAEFVIFSLVAVVLGASHERETVLREQLRLRDRMSELLQAATSVDEAYGILRAGIERLLPSTRGALYVKRSARLLAQVLVWGGAEAQSRMYRPGDCWALRRGQLHRVEKGDAAALCHHLAPGTGAYLCVPLIARGETLGVLHVVADDVSSLRQVAQAIGHQVALALGNLRLHEALAEMAIRDELTGLLNRRYLEEQMEVEVARAERLGEPIALLMVDLDHFKRFNDNYGHDVGDVVLREVARFLQEHSRGGDLVVRWGGEELVVVYPGTSLETATARAEEVRRGIRHLRFESAGQSLDEPLTLSIGVAVWPEHGERWRDVLEAADEALYEAKKERDRVVVTSGVHEATAG